MAPRTMLDQSSAHSLGKRIADHRRRCGYSQRDLAALVGRSESWVSQVERGVRRIDRMTVLRSVADAVRAPLDELLAATPLTRCGTTGPDDIAGLQMLLSAGVAPWAGVRGQSCADLEHRVAEVESAIERARYHELPDLLSQVLVDAERQARSADRASSHSLLARAYTCTAAVMCALGDPVGGWIAADRAAVAAERSGRRSLRIAAAVPLVRCLSEAGRFADAENAGWAVVTSLAPGAEDVTVALLWAEVAMARARSGSAVGAHAALEQAALASRGADPTRRSWASSAVAVCVAVELGDTAAALTWSCSVVTERLVPDHAIRFKLAVARAHQIRRDNAGFLRAALEAEAISPRYVHGHPWVRDTTRRLVDSSAEPAPALVGFAQRCGLSRTHRSADRS